MRLVLKFVLAFFLTSIIILPQEKIIPEVYKNKNRKRRASLIAPKYPSYSLAATFLLKEKATTGDPFAQHELGLRYILGIGVPLDTLSAAEWIGKAASKSLPAANFNYGIMLHNGIGVKWNPFEAFKNFKVAAESGMEQAQYIIGLMYTDNLIVSKNLAEAKKWLVKSADKGFEDAVKALKKFKKQGLIGTYDSLKSNSEQHDERKNYRTFISNDYELDFYDFGDDSLSKADETELLNEILSSDKEELKRKLKVSKYDSTNSDTTAIDIINYAANSGSPEAILIKARILNNGVGVKPNHILAASYFLKAFRLGSYKAAEELLEISQINDFFKNLKKEVDSENADAMYVWAGLIALGLDYRLTEKQALELLLRAEKKKHIYSIIELGLANYSGSLVKKDSLKALEYFKLASELGSEEAAVRLALIEIQSYQGSNIYKQIKLLRQQADKGSVLAEAALAYCYDKGIGFTKNKSKAAIFYRRAAQRGNEAAFNSLIKMYNELRPPDEEFIIY
ncbi:MAG: hypothetical protein CR986_05960 [Ignavibacteriae bacterium]|nr:MAG: hypothetical protein CR986_05960 [Ignavibacteriota bacterium]